MGTLGKEGRRKKGPDLEIFPYANTIKKSTHYFSNSCSLA